MSELGRDNTKHKHYIGALRVWRNEDHEDNLILTRHEVIELLREIDTKYVM